ncbi:hypothetical protein BDV96DRAFT_643657 [Lophiotrema nucula]|uniref:DUF7730 domain-containing protein n=1 Tax=Lophiotrema nucula TaxID=690887 RepID=A0A6A5ZJI0_9PLEO|nr:hypothetical protein BDV96DRAFT_643657 [Lophiotrema nucula]
METALAHPEAQVTLRNSSSSPLLRLPAELRNLTFIYAQGGMLVSFNYKRCILGEHKHRSCKCSFDAKRRPRRIFTAREAFALPSTCRQIHSETKALIYEHSVFLLSSTLCLGRGPAPAVPRHLRENITHIQIGKELCDSLTETEASELPLLRLPAELRNVIFAYVMSGWTIYILYDVVIGPFITYQSSIVFKHKCMQEPESQLRNGAAWANAFSLPRVSRQIYAETKLLLYSLSVFHFRFLATPQRWQEQLSPEFTNAIASLSSHWSLLEDLYEPGGVWSNTSSKKTAKLTALFSGLKKVVFNEGTLREMRNIYRSLL